ncbi:MAG: glucose-6-phosphate isomerase [Bacilli bacterium]|nr:glucose-6-phosphate isomerase [Bacilli bacterium]
MIKFDFNTYVKPFLDEKKYNELYSKKDEYINKLNSYDMIGWKNEIDKNIITDIEKTASYIKTNFELLVVIGIGGSYLGSFSFHKIFQKYFNDESFEVIYTGTTLSSKYLDELYDYLKDKNYCINVISKSGNTLETNITYKLLKDLLKRKYSEEEIKKRIIITTDKEKGNLRKEANDEGYKSFEIPNDIGGRYSFITPAHLLPLALNYNIKDIVDSYYDGKRFIDKAYEYAVIRKLLFDNKKIVENFCVYEESLIYFTEWLKQLFGETEGKNGVGILPISMLHTRDLHSLGQFVQEGNKIMFETFIKVKNSSHFIEYNKENLHTINNIVEDSVMKAHFMGNTPCIEIELDDLNINNISELIYFFMLSASFSGLLFKVNPFNQEGVEVYKKEIRESLNK